MGGVSQFKSVTDLNQYNYILVSVVGVYAVHCLVNIFFFSLVTVNHTLFYFFRALVWVFVKQGNASSCCVNKNAHTRTPMLINIHCNWIQSIGFSIARMNAIKEIPALIANVFSYVTSSILSKKMQT